MEVLRNSYWLENNELRGEFIKASFIIISQLFVISTLRRGPSLPTYGGGAGTETIEND